MTLLHLSAESGNEDVVQYLVDKGCNVNIQDNFGRTALMLAVMENYETVVNILLTAKADIHILNYKNHTVLNIVFLQLNISIAILRLFFIAVKKQFSTSEGVANCLFSAGCSLAQATLMGDSEAAVIETMIFLGFPVNYTNADNQTALHVAFAQGHLKIAKLLLKKGASPTALDLLRASPIYYLYINGAERSNEKLELLEILLASGVPLMSQTVNGNFQITPILVGGDQKAIRAVLQSDVDFNAQDDIYGMSMLHYIALNSNDGLVEEVKLYTGRWNINLVDKFQMNPLFGAVMIGNAMMVKYLLEQGSKVNLINTSNGFSTIFYAYQPSTNHEAQYSQCAELLLQYNADPQITCIINNTQVTLLDLILKDNNFNRIKTMGAQLAVIKNLGTTINSAVRSRINSHRPLKRHFKSCRRVLKKRISRSRNILQLLSDRKEKIAKYLDNQLVQKLNRFRIKNRVKIVYPYYCSILEKQCNMAKEYQEAAAAICKIFDDKIGRDHLVTVAILKFLDDRDLEVLSHIYKERPLVFNKFVPDSAGIFLYEQTTTSTSWCSKICAGA